MGHRGCVLGTAFSPDGETFVSVDDKQIVRFWSVASGQVLGEFECKNYAPQSILFNPTGRILFC